MTAKHLYEKAWRDGGLTRHLFTNKEPELGYVISMKGKERIINSVRDLDEFILDNIQELKKNDRYVGLWVERQDDNDIMIGDVSTEEWVTEDRARAIARHREQRAFWDIKNKKVIFVEPNTETK